MGKIDTRVIIAAGFALTAFSLWQMTGFYLQMDTSSVIWSGLAQGFGTGFVYVPLAAITFATLSPQFRNEGTAVFSLIRNVGSSVGISGVETMLTRNTQLMHSRLADQVTPFSDVLHSQAPGALTTVNGLSALNAEVTGQAAMIAYNNDFKLMMVLTLCAIPLVLLLRKGSAKKSAEPVVIE
jgi:MFS transporter, DHA2 family, multidrug resistance protein